MRINSTYSVKIKNYNRILDPTVRMYRNVVDYFIDVILKEWTVFSVAFFIIQKIRNLLKNIISLHMK